MSEVRRHRRQTASGKRTTVRQHTRSGDKAQREDEAQTAREAWADRAAPHVSSLRPAEPEPQAQDWWAQDDMPPPGAFWAEEDEVGNWHGTVNRAPAYQPQGDYDFAKDEARRLRGEWEAREAQRTGADDAELEARTALMFEDAARRLQEYEAEDG
jgi:hypothetical protein